MNEGDPVFIACVWNEKTHKSIDAQACKTLEGAKKFLADYGARDLVLCDDGRWRQTIGVLRFRITESKVLA